MTDFAALVRSLAAAGAPSEAIAIALEAVQSAIDAASKPIRERRAADRERKARVRGHSAEVPQTACGQSEEALSLPSQVSPTPPSSPTNPIQLPPIVPQKTAKTPGYPEAFEAVWTAYPHAKGRSSKPKAHAEWKRLDAETKAGLLPAVERYRREGAEPKMDCGAKAFERWLKDARYLDWMTGPAAPLRQPWTGPPDFRAEVSERFGEDFVLSYLDPCGWRNGADRQILARTGYAADKLSKELRALLAVHGISVKLEKTITEAAQ